MHQQLHANHASPPRERSSIFTRNDYILDATPELEEIERQLSEIRFKSESPEHHLTQAIEVLSHPEQYLKVSKHSMTLNNLGIKQSSETAEKAFNIRFAELEIDQSLKRVTMIVNCSAKEIFAHKMH